MIFSVFIADSAGNPLFWRHFVNESRLRLDGLISAFPHVAQAAASNKEFTDAQQHTYLTTPSVRYVYQPLDDYLIVIVTTKDSNLIQDLRTLSLLKEIANKYCPNPTPERIDENKFILIFAFDEAICLGYPEHISIMEIETNLTMHSVEETYHEALRNDQHEYAKSVMERRIEDFEQRGATANTMKGFGSDDLEAQTKYSSMGNTYGQPVPTSTYSSTLPSSQPTYSASFTSAPVRTVAAKASALKLGGSSSPSTSKTKTTLGSESDFMSKLSKFSS